MSMASMRIAEARPSPMSFRNTSVLRAKAPKTATMISAAAVITREVRASPCHGSRASPPRAFPSHPRHQEHLVVHRETEEDREHDHRDERRHRRGRVDPHQLPGPATFGEQATTP